MSEIDNTTPQPPAAPGSTPQQPAAPTAPLPQTAAPAGTAPMPTAAPAPQYGGTVPPQPGTPYGAPPVAPGTYQPVVQNGKATGALVCGILSILFCWTIVPGVILGIVAVVLYVLSKKVSKDGKATGGLVTGIFGIVFSIMTAVMIVAFGLMMGAAADSGAFDNLGDDIKSEVHNEVYSNLKDTMGAPATPANDDEKAAAKAVSDSLDLLKDANESQRKQLATDLGVSEYGVDETKLADWLLSDMDYTITDISLSGNSGTVDVDVQTHDFWALFENMYDSLDVSALASGDEHEIDKQLGDAMNKTIGSSTATIVSPVTIPVEKQGDTWVVSNGDSTQMMDRIFGV